MKPENTNNIWKKILYVVLIVALIILCVELFNAGNHGDYITQTDFETKLANNEISKVYAQSGNVYILKKGSEIQEKYFPKNSDYYFTYSTSDELGEIAKKISEYNAAQTEENKISYASEVAGESIISKIMPYLSIIVILLIGFMVYRMIASSNKGTMAFGKSRARVGENIKVRFSDVAGAEEEKEELREIVEFLKNPKKFTQLGARIPKGVLLVGNPGTGKTLLARAVAGESNVPFFSISGSDFVEMFVGVGAARVRDLFDQAKKNMPCIVFIDEIDAVGRQRGTGLGGGNDEREQTLNQLLVEMDGFEANDGIIVMAATNRSDVLDPALMRPGRFDRQIYVNVPDVKARESIIKIHARNKPVDKNVNFQTLARITSGFTGADLENMMNEAAILAARANRPEIIMKDLTEGINKVIMGPQKKSNVVTERDKKITAYHESGHAILGKLLEHCDEVQEVSIIPRGMAGGYTLSRPDNDDKHMTYNKLCDQIAMCMGGRLAEEIIFGDISTGASNDISQATDIARKMVTEWGMSRLGFIRFASTNEVFIGRDYQTQNNYSEKCASEIDAEVSRILKENYDRAKLILLEHQGIMDEMAKLLLDKDTIYQEDVDKLMSGMSAELVARDMEKREKKQKQREEKARVAREELMREKDKNNQLKTLDALVAAGVVSKEEAEKLRQELQAKTEEKPKKLSAKIKEKKEEKTEKDKENAGNSQKTDKTEEKTDKKDTEGDK